MFLLALQVGDVIRGQSRLSSSCTCRQHFSEIQLPRSGKQHQTHLNQTQLSIMSLARQVPRFAARISVASARPFSTSVARMAAGDAGAPRSGGSAQGDAFTKREQASEDLYVRQQEREKLEALKKKIADGKAQTEKDEADLKALQDKK